MTIKHQHQGRNECTPTVLAMLTNRPKAEVIRNIVQQLDYPAHTRWDTVNYGVYQTIKHEQFKKILSDMFREAGLDIAPCKFDSPIVAWGRAIPLWWNVRGRGILYMRYRHCWHAHVAAYEDGWIYDPYLRLPLPWKTYREQTKWTYKTWYSYVPQRRMKSC